MKIAIFIVIIFTLFALIICLISLKKYLDFDMKMKIIKIKELEIENSKLRIENDALYKHIKDLKNAKNLN